MFCGLYISDTSTRRCGNSSARIGANRGSFVAESSTSFSDDGLLICKKCEAKQTINTGDSRAAQGIAGMGYGVLATGMLSVFCNLYLVFSVVTVLGAIAYFSMVWRHPEYRARMGWQFIPATGKQYGLRQDFFVDERSNMEKATLAAAQYLKNLYAMFGDWNLALAGYNAGEGNVQRAIRRAKTNDFWALAKTKSFRSETKNYVPLIHAAIVIAKSPEFYGIDLSPEALTAVETIRVAGSYAITTVARCANTQPEEIKRLNPELRRGMTPSSTFDLGVPHGSGEQVTTCLAGERAMNYTRHIVRKRDTLSVIARMFGVSSSDIARANGLSLKSNLKPGTELAIPGPTRTSVARTAASGRADDDRLDTSYKIRKGDTLSSVAARHSTTVEAIKALNGLNSSRLSIGQVLRVGSASTDSSPE